MVLMEEGSSLFYLGGSHEDVCVLSVLLTKLYPYDMDTLPHIGHTSKFF